MTPPPHVNPPTALTPLTLVLARLDRVKKSATGYTARCPAHPDRTPSLSITEGTDGRVLLHCHRGCTFDAIVAALGMSPSEVGPPTAATAALGPPTPAERAAWRRPNGAEPEPEPVGPVVATYTYTDADGDVVYEVQRHEGPHGKTFRQRRPDPEHPGRWLYTLGDTPRTLYGLPAILDAAPGAMVFVVEGEKDVETLRAHGYLATTSGSATSWRPELAGYLRGLHVVIPPDNDEPGLAYAETVAADCLGVAESVRTILLPGLGEHGDITDWFAAGHTTEELDRLVRRIRPRRAVPEIWTWAALYDEPDEPVEIILPRLVARSAMTLFYGRDKIGKSTFLRYMITRVAQGLPLLDLPVTQGVVLYVSLEEGREMTKRRLRALGLPRAAPLFVLDRSQLGGDTLADRLRRLAVFVRGIQPDMMFVDNLTAFASGYVDSFNDTAQMHPVVQGLTDIVQDHGTGGLLLHHENRRRGYAGSHTIAAAVDHLAWFSAPDEEEEAQHGDDWFPETSERVARVHGRIIEHERFTLDYIGPDVWYVPGPDALAETVARVGDVVTASPGITKAALLGAVGGNKKTVEAAIQRAIREERIRLQRDGKTIRHWAR